MRKKKKAPRRISGFDSASIEKTGIAVLSISAGVLLPEIVINKAIPNMSPKMTGIGQIFLGAAAKAFSDNEMVQEAGSGAIAGGVLRLAKAFAPSLVGGSAPVQGIGEGDFVEDALTIDGDYDSVSGLEQESATVASGNAPHRS